MVEIVSPSSKNAAQIEDLLDHAFGADRWSKTSYRYRENIGPVDSLSRVALSGGEMLGSIQFWPARLGDQTVLLLGPIALWAGFVGQGVGSCLMTHALAAARAEGWRHVFLVGDPAYYCRFGFEVAAKWSVTMPGEDPARLQYLALGTDGPPPGPLLPASARVVAKDGVA